MATQESPRAPRAALLPPNVYFRAALRLIAIAKFLHRVTFLNRADLIVIARWCRALMNAGIASMNWRSQVR